MATSFESAKTALAPYVDNGLDPDNTRVAQRIDEAQRRLIDHYNFLSRREELEKTPLVFVEGGISGKLILDELDATKVMILALWREENNEIEMASALEQKALAFVERNLLQEIEYARRDEFQKLEANYKITERDGVVGRIGLETVARYRLSSKRIRSYVRQAYRDAVDHYNYVIRRESFEKPIIVSNDLDQEKSILEISPEVIREIVINQLTQDKA
jgi:hypothetical protein